MTCPEIMVGYDVLLKAERIWTCAQRDGHPGPHNERAPSDGCTAWADHCDGCAEHPGSCRCNGRKRRFHAAYGNVDPMAVAQALINRVQDGDR